jgi:L-fucose isomerase-like protein
MTKQMTFGVIVGSRGFFPHHLAKEGREEMIAVLSKLGYNSVVLSPEQTQHGAVQTPDDARKCAELFKKHADSIDGILVTLPNFGEERAIVDSIRLSGLKVPVLVQATPDRTAIMKIEHRRDSFCGKMSACNNLQQYNIPYSLTARHTVAPASELFAKDMAKFAATCRVVKGFHNLRIGAIGARPAAFNTVRYSEKILEHNNISVETLDLSEIMGRIDRMKDTDDAAQAKLAAIQAYVSTSGIPEVALMKMAKLGAVIDGWMQETYCTISAIQCWTSLEEYFGVVPCTVMSMMSENLFSSACETDVAGVLSMYGLALASETPSALLDWNNNYGEDEDKAVCFHCSNLPKHFFREGVKMGRVKAGAMSYLRFSTDDLTGKMRGYVGEGEFTSDPLETFGGAGVVRIPRMQKLLHYICEQGFEHHVAANFSNVAAPVYEAATKYLGWQMHLHGEKD